MNDPAHIRNWRRFDYRLTTSGQPTEDQLRKIQKLGVTQVINLGLHSHADALPDEAASVAGFGMTYVHRAHGCSGPVAAFGNQNGHLTATQRSNVFFGESCYMTDQARANAQWRGQVCQSRRHVRGVHLPRNGPDPRPIRFAQHRQPSFVPGARFQVVDRLYWTKDARRRRRHRRTRRDAAAFLRRGARRDGWAHWLSHRGVRHGLWRHGL